MPYGYATADSRRALRYRLTLLLCSAGRPLTIREMADHLEHVGRPAGEPANKSISDSLRWEIGRGRVRRVQRGVYSTDRLDPRTRWWLQRQLDGWDASAPRVDVFERVSESAQRPGWLSAVFADTLERDATPRR